MNKKYITSERKFGVEIEAVIPYNAYTEYNGQAIPDLAIHSDGSIDAPYNYKGVEFVTPPISGEAGREYLKNLCELAKKSNAKINHTCGLHVHIDTPEVFLKEKSEKRFIYDRYASICRQIKSINPIMEKFSPYGGWAPDLPNELKKKYNNFKSNAYLNLDALRFFLNEQANEVGQALDSGDLTRFERSDRDIATRIKALWTFYIIFEPVFLSFVPRSRYNNRYCKPVRNAVALDEIASANDLAALEAVHYKLNDEYLLDKAKDDHYHATRYQGLNLHSMFANGHLEIRWHSGTTNFTKIAEWVNLHLVIVDTFLKEENTYPTHQHLMNLFEFNLPALTESFFNIINLSKSSKRYLMARQELFAFEKVGDEDIKT